MAGHPQGSNRGLKVLAVAAPTSLTITNSTGSAVLGVNSSGLKVTSTGKGLMIGNSTGQLKANSTSLLVSSKSLQIGNSTGVLTVNSTAVKVAKQIQVGTLTSKLIDSNSTGVRVGGAGKYIKTNSTGN